MNTKEKETEDSNIVPNTTTTGTVSATPLNNHLSTAPLNSSETVSTTDQVICDSEDTVGTAVESVDASSEAKAPAINSGSADNSQVPRQPPADIVAADAVASPDAIPSPPPPPTTTEAACGPGESSIHVDSSPANPQDQSYPMNRLSRVSRVLMPIQQLAEASTQMYSALFHPIGASGVIIYSDGSSTDVSGLTIPYFDPIRELTAGLMSVTDPAGEPFEWNSLLDSDASHMSHGPGSTGDDYYIATYVDPEENSAVLFTSMDPVSEVPYTTLEVLDGVEIDSTRGIVISARPPPHAPSTTPSGTCALIPEVTQEREVAVSDPSSHPTTPLTPAGNEPNDQHEPPPTPPPDGTEKVTPPSGGGGSK